MSAFPHSAHVETRWYDSSWELDRESWPTDDLFLSLPLMRLCEDCCADQVAFRYAVRWQGGRPVAGAAFHSVQLQGPKLIPAVRSRWHTLARGLVDRVGLSVWMCGSAFMSGPSSYWIEGSLAQGATWLAECLESLHAQTGRPGRTVSIVKDLAVDHGDVIGALKEHGFQTMTDEPVMVLDLDPAWTSLDDYVAALKSRYRREFRRTRRALDGVERRRLTGADVLAHGERLEVLYHRVLENSYMVPVHLNAEFFARLADDLGDRATVVGYFLNDELVAFNSRLIPGEAYESYIFGMDYELGLRRCLYKNILFDDIADAIERGCSSVHLSRCSQESKSAIGARPLLYQSCARHPSKLVLGGLLRVATRIAKPTWVERHPFRTGGRVTASGSTRRD